MKTGNRFRGNPGGRAATTLSLVTAIMATLAMTACAGATDGSQQAEARTDTPAGTLGASRAALPEQPICLEGDRQGRQRNDLAEHVYDAAVARYLLENASDIGQRMPPKSEAYAMMLLADHNAYEACVTTPERCLRMELARTNSLEERGALLTGKAAYAYDRALACLQKAGDSWTARMPAPETDNIPRMEELYRERILARLVGNMMPVALLSDSSFFGTDNADLYHTALGVKEDCLRSLSDAPVDPERLAERISRDQVAALECLEQMHEPYPDDGEPKRNGQSPT